MLTGYRLMWIMVIFDLPVGTKKQRHAATKFRNFLLDQGFTMSQFSVYMRFCGGKDQARPLIGRPSALAGIVGSPRIALGTEGFRPKEKTDESNERRCVWGDE